MGTAIKHLVPDRVKLSFVIFDAVTLSPVRSRRQSARMSKITNDDLTQYGTIQLYPYGNSGRQRVNLTARATQPAIPAGLAVVCVDNVVFTTASSECRWSLMAKLHMSNRTYVIGTQ